MALIIDPAIQAFLTEKWRTGKWETGKSERPFLSAIFLSAIFLSAIFLSAGRNGDLGRGGESVHLRFAGSFAVNKLAQPHFEIDQRPEPLGMIARARLMFGGQIADKR